MDDAAQLMLGKYLADCSGRAFDWRTWNCCHFAAGWVQLATGVDAMAGLPVTPSEQSAARLLLRLRTTLDDMVSRRLGFDECRPGDARVGDLVVVDKRALGICTGAQAAVLLDGGAVGFVPMAAATHAWRVLPC